MTALKKWMEANGKTDADVAEAVRVVSRSQVNRLKNGGSKPSYDSATALERLTGIPAGELFACNRGVPRS
jgi:transcriptional regulator with XRE-family HTH domain